MQNVSENFLTYIRGLCWDSSPQFYNSMEPWTFEYRQGLGQ